MTHSGSTTDSSDRSIQPGMSIGGYKVLSVLGEGGFGVVYLAERAHPVKRRVAIKAIKPGMDSKQILARFEAERQALAVMDHTSVAKVFDAGITESGRSYFVMEYVKGIPITEHCDRLKLDISDRLKLVIQVCEAVQHAHHKGIVHRDLKPRNILVSLEGNRSVCKVIDFGVAKAMAGPLTEKTIYTEHGQIIGTPEYMSPEQAEMTNQDIDTRTDIYSLGVVLYELLTGAQPFTADYLRKGGFDHIRQVIREEEPPTPSTRVTSLDASQASQITKSRHIELRELKRELQGDLDWITLKAMEKDRQRRYETANGLAMDIQRYLDNEPIVARPPSSLYRLSKMVRRNRVAFLATAAVATALVVGLAAAMWGLTAANFHRGVAEDRQARAETAEREARQERDVARKARRIADEERAAASRMAETRRQELYAAQISLAYQAWKDGNLQRAQESLAALRPAPNQTDLRGFEWRYLWKLCQDECRETLVTRGNGGSPRLSLSKDGTRLAIIDGKLVRIWDFTSGGETRLDVVHATNLQALAISPSNVDLLATTDVDGAIWLWDLTTNAAPNILAKGRLVNSLAFSPDGEKLASTKDDGSVERWDVKTRDLDWTSEGRHRDRDRAEPALCVAYSPKGNVIASGGGDTHVRFWNAETGEPIGAPLEQHTAWVISLDFSPDGRLLATGGLDGRVILWDVETREVAAELRGHRGPVASVAFSPDGETVVSGGHDGTIRCWEVITTKQMNILRGHTSSVGSLAVLPSGQSLVSCSYDTTVKLWDMPAEGSEQHRFSEHDGWVSAVALSPDGSMLAAGDYHAHAVRLWDVRLGSSLGSLPIDTGGHQSLAISPDGKLLASGGEGVVRLWDLSTRREVFSRGCAVDTVTFSPDGNTLAVAGERAGEAGGLKFWNVTSGREIELIRGETDSINRVAFSPRGRWLLTSDKSRRGSLWDTNTGKEVPLFTADTWIVDCLAFSNDGQLVAFGEGDGSITLIDVNQPEDARRLQGHVGRVLSVAFARDGKTLASTSWDGTIKLWNVATGKTALTVQHLGPITDVIFSNDGSLMATCGADGTARVWSAASLSESDAGWDGDEETAPSMQR